MSRKNKIKAALALGGLASGVAYMKKKKICPVQIGKGIESYIVPRKFKLEPYDKSISPSPPMGWSSWNAFRNKISEDLILEIADAMKKSGLLDAGYQYINIDDCWQSSIRDEEGKLQADLTKFPNQIPYLVSKLNALGFRLGIYSSNGTLTCEEMPASLGKEAIDADTFASWGVEYFKYDFCHNKPIPLAGPEIEKITISNPRTKEEITLHATEGELRGLAKVLKDPKLESGEYVAGLSADTGKLIFHDILIDEAGEYILTLGLRKAGLWEKYAEININGTDIYPLTIPSTKGFTRDGRQQVVIKLKEGTNSILIHNPIASLYDSAATQYRNMGKELLRATKEYAEKNKTEEKPIVYSICEWGVNRPWRWGTAAGNLWRTTMDIRPIWPWIVLIYEFTSRLYKYQQKGAWNDPDMLEVGNGNLTYEENKSHFSLWCMLAAPLILGNDIRLFFDENGNLDKDNKILKILTNKEMIAINQDALGIQGRKIVSSMVDVLVKPLENQELALCFFNKSSKEKTKEVSFTDLTSQDFVDLPEAEYYDVLDVWANIRQTKIGGISATIPPHGVQVFKIRAK